jgi:hypothetical protein
MGVMNVAAKAMMLPDALAIVIVDSENPTSSKYVIKVAEYATTVI